MFFQPITAVTALSLILLPVALAKCPVITTTVQAPLCPPSFTFGPILTALATEVAKPTLGGPWPTIGPILTRPKCIRKACTSYSSISNYCPCPFEIEVSTSTLPCSSPGPCPGGCAYTSWKTYRESCWDDPTTTKSTKSVPSTTAVFTTTAVVTTTPTLTFATTTRTKKTLEPCLVCETLIAA